MQTKNRKGEYLYVRYVLLSYALSPGMVCGAYQNPHVLNLTSVREPSQGRPGFFTYFFRDPIGKGETFVDWNVVAQYLPLFEKAAWLTLRLGLAGIALAIVIGLVCALVQYYKVPVLRRVVGFYIQLSRNTPLLVQLFFIYYGLPKIGIRTDAAVCGIAGLAFLGGSYMAEAFRSGLESIEPIQTESSYSLGMDRMQTMRYVILPQAMSTSVPAFVANVIFLLKETSVFSAISLMDLMFTAKDLIGLYYKTTESLFLLVVFYLLILLPVSLLGSLLERRLRYAGFGA